jgi:hypothetical protein
MLTFHHTGIVVDNIEAVAANYAAVFGQKSVSEKYHISSQQVYVCFIEVGAGVFLELVEPENENSIVSKLKKKGHSYYHVGYMVEKLEKVVEQLTSLNYKPFEYFSSEAFGGKRCIFLFSPDAHLIELIEK